MTIGGLVLGALLSSYSHGHAMPRDLLTLCRQNSIPEILREHMARPFAGKKSHLTGCLLLLDGTPGEECATTYGSLFSVVIALPS